MMKIFREGLFAGQSVLVSGGGSGIGLAIARCFGELGAQVVIAARDEERLDQAAKGLKEQGINVLTQVVNIRDETSVISMFNEIEKQGIYIDHLVNNAGGQFVSPALDISANGFRSVVDLNLQGTFQMCQAYARHCSITQHEKKQGGNIVNIVLCLEQGIPGMAHASAARAGVVNLTKTLAWEWSDLGIRVNAIAPGTIETDGLGGYDADNLQQGVEKLLIKRMGSPDEVGQAAVFLASPAASYITGICLAQDGGEHLTGASPQR